MSVDSLQGSIDCKDLLIAQYLLIWIYAQWLLLTRSTPPESNQYLPCTCYVQYVWKKHQPKRTVKAGLCSRSVTEPWSIICVTISIKLQKSGISLFRVLKWQARRLGAISACLAALMHSGSALYKNKIFHKGLSTIQRHTQQNIHA